MPEYYEDIESYLFNIDNKNAPSIEGIEEILYKITAHSNLSYDDVSLIIRMLLLEMQKILLNGDTVAITGVGNLLVSSPQTSGNKQMIFPCLKNYGNKKNTI